MAAADPAVNRVIALYHFGEEGRAAAAERFAVAGNRECGSFDTFKPALPCIHIVTRPKSSTQKGRLTHRPDD